MMTKIKILCLSIWYPLSMSRYFEQALRHRDDVDLITTGPFTGSFIPWLGGMEMSKKYANSPDIPLPFRPDVGSVNYELVHAQLPKDWTPDIIMCIDAGITWKYKPSDGLVIHVATDPHVLNYDYQRTTSDKFFNMQKCYSKKGDIWLPYAYSVYTHYPIKDTIKDIDAVLGGMPYENRVQWINALRAKGVSVLFENGPIFDEYREMNNRAKIGLNWSSMDDLNARAFELPAMGLAPVMNYVPDIHEFMEPNSHYLEFTTLPEAIEQVLWLKNNPIACQELADRAYRNIQYETYDARIEKIFTECGF